MCDSKATGGSGHGIGKLTLQGTLTVGSNLGTRLSAVAGLATDAQKSFCAVLTTGVVRCWGDNNAGQLGDGDTVSSSVAMTTIGIADAQGIVSDGEDSFCAILTTAAVDCWGANGSGQLGDGSTAASSVPVSVTGLTNALTLSSDGKGSYCAILTTAAVECWGANGSGQLGDGSTAASSVPVSVTGLTDAVTLSSDGDGTFCATLTTAMVDCWGASTFGQLGDGSTAASSVPVSVTGLTNAAGVSSDGDDSFCSVLTTGAVMCWGANFSGELGDGTTTKSATAVAVTGVGTAASVTADGAEAYCAILTSGAVDCWGYNAFGELGNGTTTSSSLPVAVTGLTDAASISSDGDDSFCSVLTTGAVMCWGANFSGELGHGTTTASSVPVAVTGIAATSLVAGGIHAAADTQHAYCAVFLPGEVDCWGSNDFGEFG